MADDDHSDTASFKSAEDTHAPDPQRDADYHFPPEEEAKLVSESNAHKTTGNSFFASSDFTSAITTYDKALAACPTYLDYEVAVLRSNISACHLKLQEWKQAVESATNALDCLDNLEGVKHSSKSAQQGSQKASDRANAKDTSTSQVQEVTDEEAERISALDARGITLSAIQRLRTKILLRRARGREGEGGWANLAGALEDYKLVLEPPLEASLAPMDKRSTLEALRRLPPRIEESKNKEMGEMMGKLKDLGNGILKPFGLSTDNFQFTKDEKTGGYSMNFNQNGSN